ncbi:MAG: YihY/virulence factor BrkB family protein [Verrucomicrobiota bacterium]|nr:YihY/virulence factor BrkB family protein [Verrucomicrobiota bacterium]
MHPRIARLIDHKDRIRNRMWKTAITDANRCERALYAALRVGSITWIGIKENRLINRAAALSFSSLIGLIPMTAIMILVSGFALDKTDPDLVVNNIYKGISYIAPQLASLEELASEDAPVGEKSRALLKRYIQKFVDASQSGAVGISGIIVLILIVVQLFSSIEGALNDIWGVKRGRSWVLRVGTYWTVITLGTVLAGTGLAILAAQALKWSYFVANLPNLVELETLIRWIYKMGSFLMLSAVLATFYRFIPNTIVTWRASFIGAICALGLIGANNLAAFKLYSNRVQLDQTLYGSLAIVPVLMYGMYFFWLFILLGGRVSYAVQNAHFKSDNIAWDKLNFASKESISLLLLATICRRFRGCQPALSGRELAEISKLPIQYVNASLMRLCDLHLVSSIPPKAGELFQNYKYQPALPLDKIELRDFKLRFEGHGNMPHESLFDDYDPVVRRFHDSLEQAQRSALSDLTMEDIIDLTDESNRSDDLNPKTTNPNEPSATR